MSMTAEQVHALRKPFPPEVIGKLPKQVQKDDRDRGKCEPGSRYSADGAHCGGYHARSVHLDYVGHAAVTDRLLTVDPEWSWEPLALDEHGLPAYQSGNLWIRLTICGTTRLGVGDGKSAKECIGDAIRNAAMRFGVALDLWAKENLVEFANAAASHQVREASAAQQRELAELYGRAGLSDEKAAALASWSAKRELNGPYDLTAQEASQLIAYLAKRIAEEARKANQNTPATEPTPEEAPDHAA